MTHVLLAIDDLSLPLRRNLRLYLSTPTARPEPVLAPSPLESQAPDNLAAHLYGTVLHDGGRYRMWYYACHRGRNPDWPPRLRQQIARQPGWLKGSSQSANSLSVRALTLYSKWKTFFRVRGRRARCWPRP